MSIEKLREHANSLRAQRLSCFTVEDAESALAEYAAIRAALEQVEWIRNYAECLICAWCSGFKMGGHKPGCARPSALRQSEEVGSE